MTKEGQMSWRSFPACHDQYFQPPPQDRKIANSSACRCELCFCYPAEAVSCLHHCCDGIVYSRGVLCNAHDGTRFVLSAMASQLEDASPLVAALPPETDYMTYLTLLEYQLTSSNLPIFTKL